MALLKRLFLLLVIALLFSSSALADPFDTRAREDFTAGDFPLPNELDEFIDSIAYFDPMGSLWYFTGQGGLYAIVRYTAPVEFELQGLGMTCRDVAGVTSFSVFVMDDNNGAPGNTLQFVFVGTPGLYPQGNNLTYVLAEFDEWNFETFAGGEDFWVAVQVPNIANWMPYFDEEATGDRNWYGNTPSNPTEPIPGDWYIAAGGEFAGTFYDVETQFLANDVYKYHLLQGESTSFLTELVNNGNEISPAGTLTFTVEDTNGVDIWTSSAEVPALNPGQTYPVSSPDTWVAPTEEMRYIACADFPLLDDGLPDNNSFPLMQEVMEYGVSYPTYDDGESESNVVVNQGSGSGNIFYPPSYPAALSQAVFFMNDDNTNARLAVFEFDDATGAITEVWSRLGADPGLNIYPIVPPVEITSGGWFIAVIGNSGTVTIPQDNTPPVSATNNLLLHPLAMPFASGTYLAQDPGNLYINTSGNWLIRAMIDGEVPPDPPALVFPDGIITMEGAIVGEPLSIIVPIPNNGIGVGELSEITNFVPDQMFIPDADNLPIIIEPCTTYDMEFIWTPINTNLTNIGIQVTHNDPNLDTNPVLLPFQGTAAENAVEDGIAAIPAEYFLDQNRPNPFNPETSIKFGLKAPGLAQLHVFNVMGQEVATVLNTELAAGEHTVSFNGSELPSGVYFYSLEVNGYQSIQKMVLMK